MKLLDCLTYKSNVKFNIYSFRQYGEPKISKPKELRGIRQLFSIEYIPNKCRCQVFSKDGDVWIKHRDYFSQVAIPEPHELGMPLNYFAEKYMGRNRAKKFAYNDAWGSVVLRSEAWIRVDNLLDELKKGVFQLDLINDICRQQEEYHGLDKYSLCCTDMERFWEGVTRGLSLADR